MPRLSSRSAWPTALAVSAFVLVLALQIFVFQGDTISTDENSYLFQARLLASGRTWIETPPERNLAQFPSSMINLTHRRWFSRYTGGHPLALVPGVLVGIPAVVPLFLSAGTVLLIFASGRRLYDDATAIVAGLLAVLSPFYIAMHATLLSHTTSLFCLAIVVMAVARLLESRDLRWGLVAGVSIGYLFNTRPYTAVLTVWPFLAWVGWRLWRSRSGALTRQAVVLTLTVSLFVIAYLGYNHLTTGSWRVSPYTYYNRSEGVGFGRVMVSDYVHTPERGLRQTIRNLQRLNHWWLGFNGSLFVLGGLTLARWRERDVVLACSALSLVAGYFFFWFGGISTVGPVYYFDALVSLSLLGAHSLVTLWRRWAWRGLRGLRIRSALASTAAVLWIAAVAIFFRAEVTGWQRFFRDQRRLEAAVARARPGRAIVFLESGGTMWNAVQYDPRAPLDILYVRSRVGDNQRIIAQNPDREIYRYRRNALERIR
jgi:4-amino-4-deoxy-L-arabinose transferase-like glycosyltransferase